MALVSDDDKKSASDGWIWILFVVGITMLWVFLGIHTALIAYLNHWLETHS